MDEATRRALEADMADRSVTVVGNLADLQRAGAEGAANNSGPLADAAVLPANVDQADAKTPAEQDEAAGLVTAETVRTGAADKILADRQERLDKATEEARRDAGPDTVDAPSGSYANVAVDSSASTRTSGSDANVTVDGSGTDQS